MFQRISLAVAALALSTHPFTARGQAEIVPEGDIEGAGDKDIVGWNPSLSLSGTINVVNNTNVVGQVEGTSALFGLGFAGGADYINGPHLVRTMLSINEGFAKTPVVDDFVKTNDEIALESIYNYFLASKLGLFGRAKLSTALFPARAVTADRITYALLPAEEGADSTLVSSDSLKVASAFKPFNGEYSGGVFAQPLRGDALSLRVRAGFGGRHTFAEDVYVNNDDDMTPEVELQELANVHQLGAELFAGLGGKAQGGRLTYGAGASLLVPFVNNDDYDRSATDLARLALEATATVAVFDWMGIVYKGSVTVDPQLFPKDEELTQIQNSLLLTFQYALIDRKKGLKEMKATAAIDKANADKAEAEKKAKEAEERAKRLEEELERAKQYENRPSPIAPESNEPGSNESVTPAEPTPEGTMPPAPAPGETSTPE